MNEDGLRLLPEPGKDNSASNVGSTQPQILVGFPPSVRGPSGRDIAIAFSSFPASRILSPMRDC